MVVCDLKSAEALSGVARSWGKTLAVHVKVDTGMGRLGVPLGQARSFLERLAGLPGLFVRGLMTHFADAEVRGGGAKTQLSLFQGLVRDLEEKGICPPLLHVANSAALLNLADSRLHMVRVGILLYGASPEPWQDAYSMKGRCPALDVSGYLPVMAWRSRIVHLNEAESPRTVGYGRRFRTKGPTRIAIVPMGYADGYPRALTNKADVLLRGQRAPVVGAVSMDMLAVSVGHIPGVEVGDEVVLLGSQGEERVSAEEMADLAETLPYEILCGLSRRVPRVYLEGGKVVRVSYPDALSPEGEEEGGA
jgi:alanine racemase